MRVTYCSALCLSAVVLACAKPADKVVDSAGGTAATTPPATATAPPPAIVLADVAGKWAVVATPTEGKDTSVTKSTITATADTTGWTMAFAGGKPIPMHVSTSGDSIITHAGPYASVRRKGVQVTTDGVYRLQGGKLVGTTTAHYATKGADSVLHLKIEATKAP
jgi:hypothetical protein